MQTHTGSQDLLLLGLAVVMLMVCSVQGTRLYNTEGVEPRSPCVESARNQDLQGCLEAIWNRAGDVSVFWFGNSYNRRCQNEANNLDGRITNTNRFEADCYNPLSHQGPHSVVSRVPSIQHLSVNSTLNRYLEVTYTTEPGTYQGCENLFTYNQTREVSLDPLSLAVMSPFEVRLPPSIRWTVPKEEEGDMYTLLLYDVGYLMVKALWVNVPSDDLNEGETIVEYEGPLNPTHHDNPYVFLLYLQSRPLTLSDRWTHALNKRTVHEELRDFTLEHDLKGPVALNWVVVNGDAYAAEVLRLRGKMNTCAHFVARAFQAEDVKFIPNKTYYGAALSQLNVFVNVTFQASSVALNSCCSLHSFPSRTFNLNPIGSSEVLPAHARTDARIYVTLHMATAFPDSQRDFRDKLFSLLLVDPDVPSQAFGNPGLPFVHWFVLNIRGGDVTSGDVAQSYMGPAPPDPGNPHRYYFLLLLQSRDLEVDSVDYSAVNCSWAFRGRCRFDVMRLVREQDLTLVGVSWMISQHDAFVREMYVQGGFFPRCSACHGVSGYADPCPVSMAESYHDCSWWLLAMVITTLASQ